MMWHPFGVQTGCGDVAFYVSQSQGFTLGYDVTGFQPVMNEAR
jgi:hypothetical protein